MSTFVIILVVAVLISQTNQVSSISSCYTETYFPEVYGGSSGNSYITAFDDDVSYNTAYGGYQESTSGNMVFIGYYKTANSVSWLKTLTISGMTLSTVLNVVLDSTQQQFWAVVYNFALVKCQNSGTVEFITKIPACTTDTQSIFKLSFNLNLPFISFTSDSN